MALDAELARGAFTLGVSRTLIAWIVIASMSAIGLALWYLPAIAALAVSLLIAWIGWRELRLQALRAHPAALIALRCDATGLAYQLKGGRWIRGKPQTGGLVHPWLTVVRLRDEATPQKARTLVLLPDATAAANFRRLRVHLRWRPGESKRGNAEEMR